MNREFIGDVIFDFNKTLKLEIENEFKPYNIGVGQLQILLELYNDNNKIYRQSELVSILDIDKSNASRNITKLEDKGLVEVFLINKREKGIKLTELCVSHRRKIILSLQNISKKMTNNISIDELNVVVEVIKKMNNNLK